MKTFKEYSDSFIITCNTEMLDFGTKDIEYCIYEGSRPLLTPYGNVFSHPSENLIRLIVTDIQLYSGLPMQMLSSLVLYSYKKDVFNNNDDPFLRLWENQLYTDPFVRFKTSGKASNQLIDQDDPLFNFAITNLTSLMGKVNDFSEKMISEIIMEESDLHPFPELIKLRYTCLSSDQKVAVQAMSSIHDACIVLPLMLVLGEISQMEYVRGLISLKIQSKEQYSEVLTGVVLVKTYLDSIIQKSAQGKTPSALIKNGESETVEFKSTLRWDIRAGKTNPAIERACLKTISAFLNTYGGNLLIGVRDDGSIEGIETDKFANDDKFLLHLWTLIRNYIGSDFSPYIRSKLDKMEEKTVCIVDCLPSSRPAFLRQPGYDEEMYIRVGPSSNALDISEALKYIEHRFRKQ